MRVSKVGQIKLSNAPLRKRHAGIVVGVGDAWCVPVEISLAADAVQNRVIAHVHRHASVELAQQITIPVVTGVIDGGVFQRTGLGIANAQYP